MNKRNYSGCYQQRNQTKRVPLTALEIASTVNEEDVSEIFVRINSKGTALNQADFILTLMSVSGTMVEKS